MRSASATLDAGLPAVRREEIGYRNVRRAALGEVETLIAQRAIDVVIVNDFERLARTEERRYAALFHARRYSVEYRFASLGGDGRLGNTPMARCSAPPCKYSAKWSATRYSRARCVGACAARRVAFPKRRAWRRAVRLPLHWRATLPGVGAPRAGSGAAALDVRVAGERGGGQRAEAAARILKARGIKTREGHDWTSATISAKLRNPLCCGRGRLLKWQNG